ncbi:MAG: ATPase [Candidatus Rokubacteria bacterium GWC2_70_16]|nr:MAG: ATPase [Candidatus Rokubacteria bacterium GWC2_70_16]
MREVLRQKMLDGLTSPPPPLTRRDVRLPEVPGKALAVVGVRRSGKTTFLWQCLADRLQAGTPREALLLLSLEDDRLAGLSAADLAWLVEEYFRSQPGIRDARTATFFLDEIQSVLGWETFARRLVDTERVSLFLSGSSARLLSREVATSMRGRALEVLVHPFSFREALRHLREEPDAPWNRLPKARRSALDGRLRRYLAHGGFPETLGVEERDRAALLRSYVDVVVLRDVIERHAVSNPLALRWMQRHLLANPAGLFSVQKCYDALRSQGIPASKDSLHAYLGYLEDAFLVRTVSIHTASERQRMVNPRKAYPVDPGLIPLYERAGRSNLGHALETAVFLELERRGYEAAYVRTREGFQADFLATAPGLPAMLLQVCQDVHESSTWEREVRGLAGAAVEYRKAVPLLLTLDAMPPRPPLPRPLRWLPAVAWFLGSTPG